MAIIVGASGTGTEAKSDRMGIPTGTSDPASASAGDMYYHTTDKKIKIYDGSAWTELGSGGGGGGSTPAYATTGLIFDLDFGRCAFNDNQTVSSTTDLNTSLSHTTTDWTSTSSNTPIEVSAGSFVYKTANGGHIDTYSNNCVISIGGGSGNPAMSDKLNACAAMCVEGWYMYNGSGRDVLVSRFGSGFNNQFNHICDPGGQFHFNSSGAGLGGGNVDWDAFGDNVWFHCIWQYGSNSHRWWVNNVEVGTVSDNGSQTASGTSGFSIASRSDDYERLEGKVGIVRIYNRLLTNTEISTHYNAEKARFGL